MNGRASLPPRARLIIDNDFGGDPDGLFQLAHHLLSPTMDLRAVVGSQHYPTGFYGLPGTPGFACELARRLLSIVCPDRTVTVLEGAPQSMSRIDSPHDSEAARFIVREAMRDDTTLPLYVACGAGLTSIASAYLMEPRIGRRLTLLWIGGPEHDGLALPPPGAQPREYNLGIDLRAAQVVFNHSDLAVWQVPRNAYRQALVSYAELFAALTAGGALGRFLRERLEDLLARAEYRLGETYVLGDSPLVLLTALQSGWEPDPSSSEYVLRPAPRINDEGQYEAAPDARAIRVYTRLDVRLMMADFYAKLAASAAG